MGGSYYYRRVPLGVNNEVNALQKEMNNPGRELERHPFLTAVYLEKKSRTQPKRSKIFNNYSIQRVDVK